ncbi:hypothetical protein BH11ARM1_BH11ARM1_11710 [soil metagenome]
MGKKNDTERTPEEKAIRRRKHRNQRLFIYGFLFAALYGFFVWLPYHFVLFPHLPDPPLAKVDPDSKSLVAPRTKILLVTAHPDDSEFYIGGTLLQLGKTANIHQIICTDGDKAYYGPFTNAVQNRKDRHEEATKAFQTWKGQSLEFLGYPDGRLHATDEIVDKIAVRILAFKPDYILSFDPDYPPKIGHADHFNAGLATYRAATKEHIGKWLMMFSTMAPTTTRDVTNVWSERIELLGIHKSQWTGEKLDRIQGMITTTAQEQAADTMAAYGEDFRSVRIADLRD